jgi:hypothetical protein
MCPGSICGLRFAAKILVRGLQSGKGPRQEEPAADPSADPEATESGRIATISAEWATNNPCQCPRGISQRSAKRVPWGLRGHEAIDCVNAGAGSCPPDPDRPGKNAGVRDGSKAGPVSSLMQSRTETGSKGGGGPGARGGADGVRRGARGGARQAGRGCEAGRAGVRGGAGSGGGRVGRRAWHGRADGGGRAMRKLIPAGPVCDSRAGNRLQKTLLLTLFGAFPQLFAMHSQGRESPLTCPLDRTALHVRNGGPQRPGKHNEC